MQALDAVWNEAVRAAASDDKLVRADGLKRLAALDSAFVEQRILQEWPREEARRRKRARVYWILMGFCLVLVAGRLVALRIIGPDPETWNKYRYITDIWGVIASPLSFGGPSLIGAFLNRPSVSQKGMAALLFAGRSTVPAMAPFLVDAIRFTQQRTSDNKALSEEWAALVQHLTALLPRFADSDMPPLNGSQQKILLRELKRIARRLEKSPATVTTDELRFAAAVLCVFTKTPLARANRQVEATAERILQTAPDTSLAAQEAHHYLVQTSSTK